MSSSKRLLQSGGKMSGHSTHEIKTPPPEPKPSTTKAKAPILARVKDLLLSNPCPLPNTLTPITKQAVEQLTGNIKLRLLREASLFYHGICPQPTATEYVAMAKTVPDISTGTGQASHQRRILG